MNKIMTLINPPSPFLIDDRVFPNLGILKIGAALKQQGVKVYCLDLSGKKNYLSVLISFIKHNPEMCYGISATTPQMPLVVGIVEAIRKHSPKSKIILGGPHATLVNAARKWELKNGRKYRGHHNFEQLTEIFDVIVAGDGEYATFAALQHDAAQLIDADNRTSEFFLNETDIDKCPIDRELIDLKSYRYSIEGTPATSLISQLGCPFKCGFCGGRHTSMLRGSRIRSVQGVVNEISHLYHIYGYTGFMFYDDELNVNPNFVILLQELSNLQKRLNTKFALRGFIKSELFTPKQAEAMYAAGFRWVLSGFESGSQRMLQNMGKTASVEHNSKCVAIAREYGLKVKALMSLGHPGESNETIKDTQDWLNQAQPEDFDITIITTYPGSAYFDKALPHPSMENIWVYEAEKTKDKLFSIDVDFLHVSDFYKGIPDVGYQSYVYTDYLTPDELVKQRDNVDKSVRTNLGIAFPGTTEVAYEHSMGMTDFNFKGIDKHAATPNEIAV